MGVFTTFFNLFKPAKTDKVKISDLNPNWDTIDTEMHKPPLTVNGIEPDPTTRNIYVESVPLADNLASDIAQLVSGTFIERSSGGDASIEDGAASITSIKGNMVRTGYIAESLDMTVTPAERATGVAPITATIDRDTFVAYVSGSGTVTLTYTTAWSADPTDYGITVIGTPVSGDVITVVYVQENRGTITVATPTAFHSTGWNLYNNTDGYAQVVKYSDTYGYKLGGSYNLVQFSETLTGTKSALTITDGYFAVPSDGYVWITGGDATTYIYATWSDWIDSYEGNFQEYTVDTISLAEAILNFPYGLCAVGEIRDEINVNVQRAIQRIERIGYSDENLQTIIESGAQYIYDTYYIYYVLDTPVTTSIAIDGTYTVSDHGIEYFSGTTIPVYAETLYGENLKDKLRTDVLTISQQTLSAVQQAQARTNIGAASQTDFSALSGKIGDMLWCANSRVWGLKECSDGASSIATPNTPSVTITETALLIAHISGTVNLNQNTGMLKIGQYKEDGGAGTAVSEVFGTNVSGSHVWSGSFVRILPPGTWHFCGHVVPQGTTGNVCKVTIPAYNSVTASFAVIKL